MMTLSCSISMITICLSEFHGQIPSKTQSPVLYQGFLIASPSRSTVKSLLAGSQGSILVVSDIHETGANRTRLSSR